MTNELADELIRIVEKTAPELAKLEEGAARIRPAPGKWSVQEILGHLVDSAANNHQRFVRAQDTVVLEFPRYEQDSWVDRQGYNTVPWSELIELWRLYNRHLAHVMRRIPGDKLDTECWIEPYEPMSLELLLEDYLVHMKHHLGQIEERTAAGSNV